LRAYEAVLVLAPTLDEDAVVAFLARARQAIEQKGGTVSTVERWGKRRLSYDIRDFKEATYILLRLKANPIGGTEEFQHLCRISEDVLRHLIVVEEEGSSPMARPDAKPEGEDVGASVPAAAPAAPATPVAPASES